MGKVERPQMRKREERDILAPHKSDMQSSREKSSKGDIQKHACSHSHIQSETNRKKKVECKEK